jgi:hypothetical protein
VKKEDGKDKAVEAANRGKRAVEAMKKSMKKKSKTLS